jgi:hypothetical protein
MIDTMLRAASLRGLLPPAPPSSYSSLLPFLIILKNSVIDVLDISAFAFWVFDTIA